ncbi:phosphoenolpyruvate--protein phosphotransferase [bacterium BFN5]|nr:phosphoenolpyruvate--protein phosphotransferase [bacterium BFN5]
MPQSIYAGSVHEEADRFVKGLEDAIAELKQLADNARQGKQAELAEIMDAHQIMATDPELTAGIHTKILQGLAAPQAVLTVTTEYAEVFAAMDDAYLKERAADLRDIGRRIARILTGIGEFDYGTDPVILCADEIEPSAAASMPIGQVVGIILGKGSTTSHTIIIAKAQGIPTVSGLGSAVDGLEDGTQVIVDGDSGQVLINPELNELAEYQVKVQAQAEQYKQDMILSELAAVTKDGHPIQLAANIGRPADMDQAVRRGCEGVGLFRSEFLFMGRDTAPNEDEQFAAYRQVVEQCRNKLCIVRTMDIGGDKPLPYLNIAKEENPFLGFRAIRISLARPELFMTQLKAILRAGVYGPVAIMLPMIISQSEILQARKYLQQAMAELEEQGVPYSSDVPLGIMVETPAAAVLAPVLAAECDFFSIGTNDLVQYTLAVDRGNAAVSSLYSHFHPAVLNLIQGIIQAGHQQGIWVGMCGEMAGDPLATPLLAAMGIDELSMSAPAIPRVKTVIRNLTMEKAQDMLTKALTKKEAVDIRTLMVNFLAEIER